MLTPQAIEARAVAEFDANVDAYVTLHRHFVRALPMTQMLDDEGLFSGDDLRAALLAARPQARRGGFFYTAGGTNFRERIDRALLYVGRELAIPLYSPLPGEPSPTVNQRIPMAFGSVHWPALIRALPVIPRVLDYVFWGRRSRARGRGRGPRDRCPATGSA